MKSELVVNPGIDPLAIKKAAEEYFRRGDFFCSEAIIKAIKEAFEIPVSDEVIAMASGFSKGMGGAGCTCGAVAGGIMALGLFFGRTAAGDKKVKKAMKLSRELHDLFQKRHTHLCCRILTKGRIPGLTKNMKQCVHFTGEVAEETSRIILREMYNQK
jgi:C_GCAxxG_C_C family probable redox protein